MKKVYVGCSLAYASKKFEKEIVLLKEELNKFCKVTEFLGKTKGTPRQVFNHDLKSVVGADLFIAECSYPSTGLGFEIGIAYKLNIPTIAFAKKGSKVSRMIQGIKSSSFKFYWYENTEQIIKIAKRVLVIS